VSPSVAAFSSFGTAARHVDLVAPGRSVASLRDPGSFVDINHPEGLVAGDTTGRLFRGSGTSQAAAVVSGAAALVLQANPKLTPDQVKSVLLKTARPISGATAVQAGAGELDAAAAVTAAMAVKTGAAPAVQSWPVATGLGSLDAARGDSHLEDPDSGAILAGEVDVLGSPWNPARWSASSATGTSWAGGQWNGARWTGDAWTASGWARARWAAGAWARARWADGSWDRARWASARWADAMWDRARWASNALS
jgi:serine protease AprX